MSASKVLYQLSRATVKAVSARLRGVGVGKTASNWPVRAEICERCPLRVLQCGVSYCGKPFLHQIDRDPVLDGCGCPTREKAKDPKEHCPITHQHVASQRDAESCNCKWCSQRD